MNINWRKNVILKKSRRYWFAAYREFWKLRPNDNSRLTHPPILVNSIPKSGTHLLMQIVSALPSALDSGNFIASTPSFTMREANTEAISMRIEKLLPNEICGGHIFYHELYNESIKSTNALHLFIYRDPRDICISEAHYLSDMNRWHRLHRPFSSLTTLKDRVDLSIYGMPDRRELYYPSILERYERFLPWLDQPNVLPIKFEDLQTGMLPAIVKTIFERYNEKTPNRLELETITEEAIARIMPSESHTFRSGKIEQWRKHMCAEQLDYFNENCAHILDRLDYPLR
ncbi:MAG: hypothetical protein CMK89_08230 [Pseudomonadales bacterium]|nr:hypothetical protein [Pseudomonadales bacterium]